MNAWNDRNNWNDRKFTPRDPRLAPSAVASSRHFASRSATLLAVVAAATVAPIAAAGGAVTWPEGSTQFVISDLVISDSLTIEPGVTVLVNGGVEIMVASGGSLNVQGTEQDPVLFAGNSAARWEGVKFAAGSSGTILHATIEHTNTIGLSIASSPVIQGCVIQDVVGVAPGGAARGIHVLGAVANPVISNCLVQSVVGANGTVGSNTGAASNGPNGADGTFFAPNADNGGGGGGGGIGGTGSIGGMAVGIAIESDASASMASNRIRAIKGGVGGKGGNGGVGGDGGDGGEGANGIFVGGSGSGGNGGAGGKGGTGGVGGAASGMRIDSDEVDLAFHQLLIVEIDGGKGGQGGNGGLGGDGGDGGNGLNLIPAIFNTDGGDAGNGGAGGAQGNGGAGGACQTVEIVGEDSSVALTQSTCAMSFPGTGGATGFANLGGFGGFGGGAVSPASPGDDGDDGANGGAGTVGVAGVRQGVVASDVVSVELHNTIVALGDPASGVALVAGGGASIDAVHCALSGYGLVSQGAVDLGPGTILADPDFVAADAGDFTLDAGSVCIDAGDALGVAYRRNAHCWSGAVQIFEPRAFDEFAPGVVGATGCLLGDGSPATIDLAGGAMTVSALSSGGGLMCAVTDGSTPTQVSDGSLSGVGSTLRLEFDPPVWAFYAYFGSLTIGDHGTMALYSSNALIEEINGLPSPTAVMATGFGVLRTAPFDRIDISVGVDPAAIVGAFVGLASNEPSLGTVTIPGYVGPGGSSTIQLDFACAFADTGMGLDMAGAARVVDGDGNAAPVIDIGAMEFQGRKAPPCPADFDGNGVVDGADFGVLLSGWGGSGPADLNGDGIVDGADVGLALGAWGACPE